jgi:hypothetical protein
MFAWQALYHLTHSTSPVFWYVLGIFELGFQELFTLAAFQL